MRASMGARLKEERNRLDLSQDELGQLCDVKRRTLQDWERGVNAPSAEFLAAAATHGVDPLYVVLGRRVGGGEPIQAGDALTADEAILLGNYRSADEDGRQAARVVLAALGRA